MVTVQKEAVRKALVTSLAIIAVAAPGYAQTPQTAAAGIRDQQFVLFMGELRRAVRAGADSTLKGVRLDIPEAELQLVNQVDVEGFRLEEGALFFRVRV